MSAYALDASAGTAQVPPFYLGRQPILDLEGRVVAYELLFRPKLASGVTVEDDRAATAAVISHAFNDLGIGAVLGGCDGFINFDAALLMSEVPELLPPSQVVLEILETVEFTPPLVDRCRELRQLGFRFALDDVVQASQLPPEVLDLIDIVKVDLGNVASGQLSDLVAGARAAGVRLLAEKVDNEAQVGQCRALGFELFQGYFFARPTLLEGRKISPDRQVLLKLLQQVAGHEGVDKIAGTFKSAPDLTLKLMRLVNSVGLGATNRIQSVTHALVVLGERQLHRWIQVLLFADQSGNTLAAPLLTLAASRGRLMELIAEHSSPDREFRDQAFMTGIMSLLDTLMQTPMETLLEQVNLGHAVQSALLMRAGRLGRVLRLVEALERKDEVNDLPRLLPGDSDVPLSEFPALQVEAMRWANEVVRVAAPGHA